MRGFFNLHLRQSTLLVDLRQGLIATAATEATIAPTITVAASVRHAVATETTAEATAINWPIDRAATETG